MLIRGLSCGIVVQHSSSVRLATSGKVSFLTQNSLLPHSPHFSGISAHISPPFKYCRGGKNRADSLRILSVCAPRSWPYLLSAGRRPRSENISELSYIITLNLKNSDAKLSVLEPECNPTRSCSASIDTADFCCDAGVFFVCVQCHKIRWHTWDFSIWRLRSYWGLGNMGGMCAIDSSTPPINAFTLTVIVWRVLIDIQNDGGGQTYFKVPFWEQGSRECKEETVEGARGSS